MMRLMKRVAGLVGFAAVLITGAGFLGVTGVQPVVVAAAERSCESLIGLSLPNASITMAETVSKGSFVPPGAARAGGPAAAEATRVYTSLPSFCRVAATLKPTADSDIKIEVWMPAAEWNGKFQAVGNGGLAGVISYSALAAAVAGGYASASTDTGHVGGSATFATGHPERIIDFGYRSLHEMTVHAKTIVDAFYAAPPKLSFWNGCSQGGRQGINEAMRYPGDFDGIVAGASSVGQALLHAVRLARNLDVNRSADSYIPPEKYPAIHDAALHACDAADGVKDGVIDSPLRCRFDPKVLECKGADSPSCLTAPQVETARLLYAPVTDAKSKRVFFPPLLLPGSELSWGTLASREPYGTAVEGLKYLVFKDPTWDASRFDLSVDADRAVKMDAGVIGLADPNLRPFFDRGGKLLMYQGWADPQMPVMNSVTYFNNVVKEVGRQAVGNSIQLYMVPGMGHCQGGPGTDRFDKMAAIEQWVSTGKAPDFIVASHATGGKVDRTRPVCPYGQAARWNGKGSTDEAANFACVAEAGDGPK
jgi:feruloyl esterase